VWHLKQNRLAFSSIYFFLLFALQIAWVLAVRSPSTDLLSIDDIAAIWLAFGPQSACLAALVLGLGEPWAFTWTGGSIGRYLWFFLVCGGVALIKQNHRFSGAFSLCMAGMLRLFPLEVIELKLWKQVRNGCT